MIPRLRLLLLASLCTAIAVAGCYLSFHSSAPVPGIPLEEAMVTHTVQQAETSLPPYVLPKQVGAKKKKSMADRARFSQERLQFEFDMVKDPVTGKIPDNIREIEMTQALRAPKMETDVSRGAGVTVTPRGPNNLGGRTRAIGFDVRDPQIIISGGVSSGVFKTINGGASWTKVSDNDQIHNVTAIAQDTRAGFEDVWYYATGEALGNSADLYDPNPSAEYFYSGIGIYRSDDNGDSWTLLGNSNTGTLESLDRRRDLISRLVVDPTNGDVYAACIGEIIRSTDGGLNWASVLADPASVWSTAHLTDVIVTPTGRLYAAFSGYVPNNMDGVWTSTDGTTWTHLAGTGGTSTPATWHTFFNYGRVVLDYAPSNEDVVYILYDNTYISNCGAPGVEADLFRMEFDGVSVWSFTDLTGSLPDEAGCLSGNDPFAIQQGYDLCISVKPDDEDHFFIGGTNAYDMVYNPGLGTATATRIGGYAGAGTYAQTTNHHSDIHTFAFKPGDPDTLFTGTDGGIQKTAVSPVGWIGLNNDYVTYQEYHVAISPNNASDLIFGGAQDNGTHFSTTGTNHTQFFSGDGVAVHLNAAGDVYFGTQLGAIYRYDLGASSLTAIRPSTAASSLFVTYFYLDPDNDEYLYYADGQDLYRTASASTVSTITWDLMTGINAATSADIFCMATSRGSGYNASDANRKLYIGTEDGDVFVLDDPAFTAVASAPTDITPPTAGGGVVSGIAVHPTNDDEVIVTYSNYNTQSVFHTTDGGNTWTEIEGNISQASFRSCTIMEESGTVYYFVGTSVGMYCTTTLAGAGTIWTQVGASEIGYAVVSAQRLRPSDNVMAVGTHGNGMFTVEPPRNPEVIFAAETATTTETGGTTVDCRDYEVVTVDMRILAPPTGDATVTLSTGGTATEGADYDLISNPLTFLDGATANQTVTLWVYDDTDVESDETVELTFVVSGTTDATAGSINQTYTLTIQDNDDDPNGITTNIWTEDWESGVYTDWLISAFTTPVNYWFITNSCNPVTGTSAQIVYNSGAGLACGYLSTLNTGHRIFRQVDATGLSTLEVTFDYICPGEGTVGAPDDYGQVVYSIDGGFSWIAVGDALVNTPAVTNTSVALPASLDGTTFLLGWEWIEDGDGVGGTYPLTVDNISVDAGGPATVESDLTIGSISKYIGPFETVYFYDAGELICSIENTSAHDFGCTEVTVDRNGTGITDFWYLGNDAKDLADKTIFVDPTNNSPTATYNITLYYTQAEVAGWEAATGKVFNTEIQMVKNPGAISNVNPAAQYPDGSITIDSTTIVTANLGSSTSVGVTASFANGFSGFGVGDPGPPPATVLPVENLSLSAHVRDAGVDLNWVTEREQNMQAFEVERSSNGLAFEKIGELAAKGFTEGSTSYSLIDEQPVTGMNYYRLRQLELDGSFTYSQIVKAWITPEAAVMVSPTAFTDYLFVTATGNQPGEQAYSFSLYNSNGQEAMRQELLLNGNEPYSIAVETLPAGVYVYTLRNANGQAFTGRLIRR